MERDWDPSTPAGLRAILERPRVSLSRACQAVEQCLAINRDNTRDFFEQCFPVLLKRLFGYDGSSWLSIRDGKEQDMTALLSLLSPRGALFQAMRGADVDGATRFLFPRERLPTHTQMLLATAAGRAELLRWPQYESGLVTDAAGRISVHMGVTQYFLAWFSFYVLRGGEADSRVYGAAGPDGGGGAAGSDRPLAGSVRQAVSGALHLPLLHQQGASGASAVQDAYLSLLVCFLKAFFPQDASAPTSSAAASHAGLFGGASARSFSSSAARIDASPSQRSLATHFLSTLVEFWLTDGEEPLPGTGGLDLALWTLGYEPPSEEALAAIQVLATYVAVEFDPGARHDAARVASPPRPAQRGAPWLPVCPVQTVLASPAARARAAAVLAGPARLGAAASPGAQALARRLFRFLARAVRGWSSTRSTRSLALTLCAALYPWLAPAVLNRLGAGGAGGAGGAPQPTPRHLLTEFLPSNLRGGADTPRANGLGAVASLLGGAGAAGGAGPGRRPAPAAAPAEFDEPWEAHVLAFLPFYTTLLPLFLEHAVGWAEARPQETAEAVRLVLDPLAASAPLRAVLESAERAEAAHAARQHQPFASPVGTPRGDARSAAGPASRAAAYSDVAPWLTDRAADWLEAAEARCYEDAGGRAGAGAHSLFCARGDDAASPAALAARAVEGIGMQTLAMPAAQALHSCVEAVFGSSPDKAAGAGAGDHAPEEGRAPTDDGWQRLPTSSWRDVRFKGDPLLRPIGRYELAWLARPLVALSLALNRRLGLGPGAQPGSQPPETRWEDIVRFAARRGWQVNLRPLADVRNLGWAPVALFITYWLLRLIQLALSAMVGALTGRA